MFVYWAHGITGVVSELRLSAAFFSPHNFDFGLEITKNDVAERLSMNALLLTERLS